MAVRGHIRNSYQMQQNSRYNNKYTVKLIKKERKKPKIHTINQKHHATPHTHTHPTQAARQKMH